MRDQHKRLIVSLYGINLLPPFFIASYTDSMDPVSKARCNHESAQFMKLVHDSENSVGFSSE